MKYWLAIAGALCLNIQTAVAQEQTCDTISWHADVLAEFPNIGAACQDVVIRNGETFAKLTGNVMRIMRNGNVTIDVQNTDGTSERRTFRPNMDIAIDGPSGKLNWGELPRGYSLNFYIPSDRFELASFDSTEEVDTGAEMAMATVAMPKTATQQNAWLVLGAFLIAASLWLRRASNK